MFTLQQKQKCGLEVLESVNFSLQSNYLALSAIWINYKKTQKKTGEYSYSTSNNPLKFCLSINVTCINPFI